MGYDLPICRVIWPGLDTYLSATLTLGHGISPGVCVLNVPPQGSGFAPMGDLEFRQGNVRLKLTGCRVDSVESEWTSEGLCWRIVILDRRWRWKFGAISGRYNIRNRDLSIKNGQYGTRNTEATPQDLAKLCFDAMGETGYDVADLPNDTRPEVDWDGDLPAEALARLCESLGCRIVPTAKDTFAIRVSGVGQPLPKSQFLEYHEGFDTAECPDQIGVRLAPTLIEVHLPLQAVIGTEIFGVQEWAAPDPNKWPPGVPIEERAPHPYQRWIPLPDEVVERIKTEAEGGFQWVIHNEDDHVNVGRESQRLLKEQVLRYYQVKLPFTVPNWATIDSFDEFELEQHRAVTYLSPEGERKRAPAYVYGVFCPDYRGNKANGADEVDPDPKKQFVYQRGIQIDDVSKLVVFPEPVVGNYYAVEGGKKAYGDALDPTIETEGPGGAEWLPAELVLVTAIRLRTAEGYVSRYGKTRQITPPANAKGKKPAGEPLVAWARYEDAELQGIVEYVKDTDTILKADKIKYNETGSLDPGDKTFPGVAKVAEYYLDYLMSQYQTKTPQSVVYPGLFLVELDGAIEGLTISASNRQPAQTVVSRHNELSSGLLLPFKERRRLERGFDAFDIEWKKSMNRSPERAA